MSKTFTAFLFFFLVTAISFAQTHTLNLSKQRLEVQNRNFYISGVIDARIVDTSVGVVQKGLVNSKAAAVFQKPLAEELQSFTAQHLPKQNSQYPVMLRVNKFWVSEHTMATSESGTAEIRVDFIYEQDGMFNVLYSTSSLKTSKGLDVTKKHEENIASALAECLQEFANRDWGTMLAQAERLTPAELNQKYGNADSAQLYPILTADSYVPGIYLTLDEFRTNSPSIITGYQIRERGNFDKIMMGGGTHMPVMTTAEGKSKPMKAAWGFSSGTDVFINVDGGFFQITRIDNKFSLVGTTPNHGAILVPAAGAVAGIVGGLVAAGVSAATTKQVLYTLNLETGALEMDGVPVGMNSKPAQLILYRELKNEAPQPVVVKVNGETFSLETNQLVELKLNTHAEGASICLNESDDTCHSFMPLPGEVYYMVCSLNVNSKDGKPVLKPVDRPSGEYAVKGVKFAQLKAEKKKSKSKD